tara:strand:+ start:1143 stop:1313 length:171 start_codon:yes stop_codon:yes gene_type:complete
MDITFNQIVELTAIQIIETPSISDEQLLGYVQFLGVFIPDMRWHIVEEAKMLVAKK